VREQGSGLASADDDSPDGFALLPSASKQEGRLKGDEVAIDALSKGTVYKQIAGILRRLREESARVSVRGCWRPTAPSPTKRLSRRRATVSDSSF
jgi:hypothetical protein